MDMVKVKNIHPVSQIGGIEPGEEGEVTFSKWATMHQHLERIEEKKKPRKAPKKTASDDMVDPFA